jgi:OFA family oxalate/formate antiporter-like MFS transporter
MEQPQSRPAPSRWLIAIMGTVLQLCLGTVYAWSYFQDPLTKSYCWTNSQVMLAFSLAICFLGLAAAFGGMNLKRFGPRKLAVTGGILFGAGYLLAGLALSLCSHPTLGRFALPLLYLGYGVIGGIGLGLGYVTPVATVAKWFPDKKGLVTGMVVMGFGFGALLMSKVLAPMLLAATRGGDGVDNYSLCFLLLGAVFIVVTPAVAAFLRNPPQGWSPAGYTPPAAETAAAVAQEESITPGSCLLSGRFLMMWAVFFCNIAAGIAIISLQAPMMKTLWKSSHADVNFTVEELAAIGGTLIAISSIFNGLGRFFWGGVSDRIGRVQTFRIMLGTQIAAFVLLIFTGNPWLFGALICYILLCYGGGFGTMPSFVLDVFGSRMMAIVYGVILTAWSAAGIAGPQIFAWVKDALGPQAPLYSFIIGASFLGVGAMLSLLLSNHRFQAAPAPARAMS